jgi:hypothetical protein
MCQLPMVFLQVPPLTCCWVHPSPHSQPAPQRAPVIIIRQVPDTSAEAPTDSKSSVLSSNPPISFRIGCQNDEPHPDMPSTCEAVDEGRRGGNKPGKKTPGRRTWPVIGLLSAPRPNQARRSNATHGKLISCNWATALDHGRALFRTSRPVAYHWCLPCHRDDRIQHQRWRLLAQPSPACR